MAKKKFEELNLKDAFLFGAALEDPETYRISLEVMLGKEIAEVTEPGRGACGTGELSAVCGR